MTFDKHQDGALLEVCTLWVVSSYYYESRCCAVCSGARLRCASVFLVIIMSLAVVQWCTTETCICVVFRRSRPCISTMRSLPRFLPPSAIFHHFWATSRLPISHTGQLPWHKIISVSSGNWRQVLQKRRFNVELAFLWFIPTSMMYSWLSNGNV